MVIHAHHILLKGNARICLNKLANT